MSEDDMKWCTPFRCSIIGPSESGKSLLIKKLLEFRNDLFAKQFDRIIYALPAAAKDPQVNNNSWTRYIIALHLFLFRL